MGERWDSFMADEEWSRIKRETTARHGELFGRTQSRMMHQTPCSPPLG
jgi:hypothetical protein